MFLIWKSHQASNNNGYSFMWIHLVHLVIMKYRFWFTSVLFFFFFSNTNSAQGYVFVSLYCLVLHCMLNLMLIPVKQLKQDKWKNYLSNHFFSLRSKSLKNKLLNQLYAASQLGIQNFLFSENVNKSETDLR